MVGYIGKMIKEIGSIFPLHELGMNESANLPNILNLPDNLGKVHYYSLCREALFDIARHCSQDKGTVLLPAYTCDTVYLPFKQLGWNCEYYSINNNLSINLESFYDSVNRISPDVVVVHPFFGMDLCDDEMQALSYLKLKQIKLIVDVTQCIFSGMYYDLADFCVGSLRKWFAIPDGAFLFCRDNRIELSNIESENTSFVTMQTVAMYLRDEFFREGNENVKALSVKLNKCAESYACEIVVPHTMSSFSMQVLSQQNVAEIAKRRLGNYRYLFENIHSSLVRFVCEDMSCVTSAPLYFSIYLDNPKSLQRFLASEHIYAPVIWPVGDEEVLIDDAVKNIYGSILSIPIDQRYDLTDMEKIVSLINSWKND